MPCGVKGPDHLAKLVDLAVVRSGGGKRRLGGREGDGAVTPEVAQPLARDGIDEWTVRFLEFVDGQQLDSGNAQGFEVGNFFDQAGEGAGPGRQRGRMAGEAAHVQFVDDTVLERHQGGTSSRQWNGRRRKTLRRDVTWASGSDDRPQTAPSDSMVATGSIKTMLVS